MITQSFLYNAIFFSYAIVLANFYLGPDADTSIYYIPFAIGNFLGPLLLGPVLRHHRATEDDRRHLHPGGRAAGDQRLPVPAGVAHGRTQTVAWCVIFFFASAGASAAYLTVSEIFPMEVRAKAIAVFFAIAQVFGSVAPLVYAAMIGPKDAPSERGCSTPTSSARSS